MRAGRPPNFGACADSVWSQSKIRSLRLEDELRPAALVATVLQSGPGDISTLRHHKFVLWMRREAYRSEQCMLSFGLYMF